MCPTSPLLNVAVAANMAWPPEEAPGSSRLCAQHITQSAYACRDQATPRAESMACGAAALRARCRREAMG